MKRKDLSAAARRSARRDLCQQRLQYAASHPVQEVLAAAGTNLCGLDAQGALHSRETMGANAVRRARGKSLPGRLVEAFINPFTAILLCLMVVSVVTDIILPRFSLLGSNPSEEQWATVVIILTMVVISGTLRFVQESRSGRAAEALLAMITTTCTVVRKGCPRQEIPLEEVVVGDIVHLSAGDMIPADVRILEAKDLFVTQSGLTGESVPVEKTAAVSTETLGLTDQPNLAFMGSNVISGTALAVVICAGDDTLFGSMAAAVTARREETGFTRGVNDVSRVLIRFMLVMAPLVLILCGITKGNWLQAFLFAISVAVGLTPEMLPMIVTTCLAKGAVVMSRKKTIVKNLHAIQNFGAMDILCTDKTGTLTRDEVVLEYHLNVNGQEDMRVLRHAYLNSYFQTGYRNLMDLSIIRKTEEAEERDPQLVDLSAAYEKVDEVPFDFARRRLSTVVRSRTGKTQMVAKGAVEEMLEVCSFVEVDGSVEPLTARLRRTMLDTVRQLNDRGFRVLVIAQKSDPSPVGAFSAADEREMVLMGYLAFLDPPKDSAPAAIQALREHGVTTKVLTGDNEKVTATICRQVGLEVRSMLLGPELEEMSDEQLGQAAEHTQVFARLTPEQKARVITVLRRRGHTVGFLGDGINDAAAMKAADIGISVDTAVDIAKESADIILLEKDLMVLEQGILEGRRTYANMIKYIKMTASSNFGNIFSVLVASALLPFLPMMSLQLILLNLIYDVSCTALPWDNVDPEFLTVPRTWDASSVSRFMVWMGPVSSVFDLLTYAVLYFVICPAMVSGGVPYHQLAAHWSGGELAALQLQYVALFQAGWFIESMWTQSLVIHMLRTPKAPFLASSAAPAVTVLTVLGTAVVTVIPFTPLGPLLGFAALPGSYFLYLAVCVAGYLALATVVKRGYLRRYHQWL